MPVSRVRSGGMAKAGLLIGKPAHGFSTSRDCNTPLGGAIEPKNAPPQFPTKILKSLGRKVPKAPAFDTFSNQKAGQLRPGQGGKFRPILIARRRPRIRPGRGVSINLREAFGQI